VNSYELLAPAGNFECIESALRFGADAVYMGGPEMQLRSDKVAFTRDDLEKAAEYVHAHGARMYVTVNSFARNGEIDLVPDYAKYLYDIGVDAVIVTDIGVLTAIKKSVPELPVHISTQANCMNWMAASTYYNMGAERIVLARELSLEDIAEIRARTPASLELEAFVHGAMCMAFSGRCLISSYLNNRSGNRGECTQPCRWSFSLMEKKRPGEYFPVEEDECGSAILSSHDLCCIDFLDKLKEAGVTSFKIEGRMKTAYYVATVVNAYRMRLDNAADEQYCRRELTSIAHRPYSTGFYFGQLRHGHNNDGAVRQSCVFVGVVQSCKDGVLTVEQRNRFSVGETLELLSPGKPVRTFDVASITAEDGTSQTNAPHPQQIVTIPCPYEPECGDILRRRDGEKIIRRCD